MELPFRTILEGGFRKFFGRRFAWATAIAIVASILSGFVDFAFAIFIQLFLASMGLLAGFKPPLSLPGADSAIAVGVALLVLGGLRAGLTFVQAFTPAVANEEASSKIRSAAILRLIPRDDKNRLPVGDAYFIYSEISAKGAQYLLQMVRFVASVLQALFTGAAMFYLAWQDSLIATAMLFLAGLLLLRINISIGKAARLIPESWQRSVSSLESAGRNWFYLRIKHLHDIERNRLLRINNEVYAIGLRLRRLAEVGPSVLSFLGVVLIAVLASTRALVTHTSPPVFLSFLYMFIRFAQVVGDTARNGSSLVEFSPYLNRMVELIRSLPEPPPQSGEPKESDVSLWGTMRAIPGLVLEASHRDVLRPKELRAPALRIDNLSFRYLSDRWILKDLAVRIDAGRQLAIVGPSGCGKSTLLALLLGFLKPAEGAIRLDEIDPQKFCSDYAEFIGYVGPEPYIVSGTIRENVLFGCAGKYSDDEIWRALSQAALADVVRAMPKGLDTPIRHHDVELSMGQRQRLALARALLPQPVLLVMDEVSANLDDATEDAITESILKLKGTTTTIIVSHRLGIVKHADEIIDLGRQIAGAGRVLDSQRR